MPVMEMSSFQRAINQSFSIGDQNESRKCSNQEKQIVVLCPEKPEDFVALKKKITAQKCKKSNFFFLQNLDAEGNETFKKLPIDIEKALKETRQQENNQYKEFLCIFPNETSKFYACITGPESSRWTALSKLYTEEAAVNILQFAMNKVQTSPEARINKTKPKIVEQHQGKEEEKGKNIATENFEPRDKSPFYPEQRSVGETLLQRVSKKVKIQDRKFENFTFVFLVPDRKSLEEQTKERANRDLPSICKENDPNLDDIVIRINTKSVEMKDKWSNVMEKVKENPNTLFIIIHDECHWAAGHGKGAATFMGFGKCDPEKCHKGTCKSQSCLKSECKSQDYHFNDEVKIIPNLFTIMVSATPFNHLVIPDITKNHIVDWKAVIKNQRGKKKISNSYQGLTELRRQKKIKSFTTEINTLRINGFSHQLIGVLVEYASALSGSPCPNNDIFNLVKECVEKKKLIVLRVSKASNKLAECILAVNVLKRAAKEGNITNLNILSDETKIKDLPKDAATIFIIVEIGRMGDTLPQNFLAFDLRSRYFKTASDFTTIIQDAGRAFGYGKRPTLLLSPEADEFLKNAWDDKKDSISEEGFKKHLNAHLGPNMTKKEIMEDDENSESQDEDDLERENDLNIIQAIFEPDKNNPVFLYKLEHPQSFDHRLFLKAEPQIGKTGAILSFLFQLSQKVPFKPLRLLEPVLSKEGSSARVSGENSKPTFLETYTKTVYENKTLSEICDWIETKEGKEKHQDYTKEILVKRKARKEKKIPEPSKCASVFLVEELEDTDQLDITIADFGCADMAFAMHLDYELGKLDAAAAVKKKKITVKGFDFQVSKLLNIFFIP